MSQNGDRGLSTSTKILVVDDEPDVNLTLKVTLQDNQLQ